MNFKIFEFSITLINNYCLQHRSAGDSESSRPASVVESPPNLAGLGFGCQHCPETFISTEGLVEHMKVAHVHHSPFTIHPLPCKKNNLILPIYAHSVRFV